MYLSRGFVPAELSQPERTRELHSLVYSLFPSGVGMDRRDADSAGVLYRIDGRGSLLLQSRTAPRVDLLRLETKQFEPTYTAGSRRRFRLSAAPHRGIGHTKSKTGKRDHVPLRGLEEQEAWVLEKCAGWGFAVEDMIITESQDVLCPGYGRGDLSFARILVDGVLTVTDAATLIQSVTAGVGRGRAWGCGLLSVA